MFQLIQANILRFELFFVILPKTVNNVDTNELLTLWLADRVADIVSEDEDVAYGSLSIAVEKLEENGKVKVL